MKGVWWTKYHQGQTRLFFSNFMANMLKKFKHGITKEVELTSNFSDGCESFFPRKERQHWILFLESEKWFYFQFQWELTTVRRNFQYRLYWAKSDRPASTASHDFLGRPTFAYPKVHIL
jgi:hypothetical protein